MARTRPLHYLPLDQPPTTACFWPLCDKPVTQRVQRVVKTVKDWTEDSVACSQECFDCTDWEMFDQMCTNFNELTNVSSSYISFCVESVIPSKHITIFPNNKPWVTKDLKGVLNKKKRVFFQGTTDEKKH